MAKPIKRRDKWYFLTLGAKWDRAVVPIYEAAARGKCVPLLKTLLTSHCKNDCKYCAFRAERKCLRTAWNPQKLAEITMHLWSQGKIRGLFLSSSVAKDPDHITEKQLEVLNNLRSMGYSGYIHLRIMPGTSRHYIREAVKLADRVGVNLEAPNSDIFDELCPDKGGFKEAILKRLDWIIEEVISLKRRGEVKGRKFGFSRAGIDTQLIVGAVEDNDLQHIRTTEWLYKKLGLRRVYYSGFEPIPQTPLEKRPTCPPWREYRLYQASFLIRDYGITSKELETILNDKGFLPNMDPKRVLAKINPEIFPVDLNTASFYEIVRIPHIGPTTAKKILEARKTKSIKYSSDLEKILGPHLARKVLQYVEVKDKSLVQFQNNY
ncbi:helix-hairpin-helix domain-containing protein [Candidatus Bathyarchaeota archaeon]|nr:helix-hairpin-helix domain-containing protein [Candidatus Bathyarchaeota archaeon]